MKSSSIRVCASCYAYCPDFDLFDFTLEAAQRTVGPCNRHAPQAVIQNGKVVGSAFPIVRGGDRCMEWVDGQFDFAGSEHDDLEF